MSEELSFARNALGISSPTTRDLATIAFRQWRVVVASFVVVMIAVLVYAMVTPPYQAKMEILVRKERVDPVLTPAPTASPQVERHEITEEELNSEVELLRDEEILRTVVEETGLASGHRPWLRFWERNDPSVLEARAMRQLAKRLTVEPFRKTNLIAVTYDSADPNKAAEVLQCLANAYLRRHQKVHRTSGESTFFEQQMLQSQASLQEAELRIIDFAHHQGVVSAELQRDLALQKLSDADASDRQVRVQMAEAEHRLSMLKSKLESTPERALTQIRMADNPELQEKMKSKLLELLLKRTQLMTKFQPSYKLVQEVDEQIAETRSAIAAEALSPVKDETTDVDPTHEWARTELAKTQVELSGLQARSHANAAVLSDYKKVTQGLGDRAVFQEQLRREMKAAEEKYLLYANKREEARIGDALDRGGLLNVAIAESPVAPVLPVRSRASLALFGILLAGTFSTALAFATDYLDPGFRTPDEVTDYLHARVLASLPRQARNNGGIRPQATPIMLDGSLLNEAGKALKSRTNSVSTPWSPEHFANEQLLSLVEHIFLTGSSPCREVVFSAVDPETDVNELCLKVAKVLTHFAGASVCVVDARTDFPILDAPGNIDSTASAPGAIRPVRDSARQVSQGLWTVSGDIFWSERRGSSTTGALARHLNQLREEFDYCIVQAPAATTSGTAELLGRRSDGLILVLKANSTRRLAAQKVQSDLRLTDTRLIGAVLTERRFPIPEKLYKRL